ncbi:hypothetical protein PR002_g24328 [Phytophthora rubi]|uniref:RxLR effector protein n=1 Tax=Phytophthora rubi TaxID=129364 RepID=A0A6A3IA84_9STRA|nr:hypothetical protein PR002_g24328 [Phytophthora rubi]
MRLLVAWVGVCLGVTYNASATALPPLPATTSPIMWDTVPASTAQLLAVTAASAISSVLRSGIAKPPLLRGSAAICPFSHALPVTVSSVNRACHT